MKILHAFLVFVALVSVKIGPSFAQNPGEFFYYDTSLTACPNQNQVLSYFVKGSFPHPRYYAGSWCGAPQKLADVLNADDAPHAPYILEECQAGQYWIISNACSRGETCADPTPPGRGRDITMVCRLRVDSPEDPPLGCITGSGGFSRCLRDEGVLPSSNPPGTPVNGGLNPNPGPPGDDWPAEAPTQVWPGADANQGTCTRAEAIGNPIFAGTGNKFQEEIDYPASSDLGLTRYYNSSLPGWTHNYSMRVLTRQNRAVALRPQGRSYFFSGSGPGKWTGDPATRGQLFRLDEGDPSGSRWKYLAVDGTIEYYDAEGRIMRIVRRGGQTVTALHEQGLLRRVTDPFGRRLTFEYDEHSRLRRVWSFSTDIGYGYDDAGRLSWAVSGGTLRNYLYENTSFPLALTAIVENGRAQPLARWSYDTQGRAVASEHAGGVQRHQLDFGADGSVSVIDALGTTRVQHYAGAGARQVFSGQSQPCVACVGDAAQKIVDGSTGVVLQSRDYLGSTTAFTYEARQLPSSITLAQDLPEQRRVDIDWHPTLQVPVRVREPGRTTEYTYDAAGNMISGTLIDTRTGEQRTWRWTYNAQGLADSMIDPRGGLWRYAFDAQGNRTSVVDPAGHERRYTFDAAGNVLTEDAPARATRNYSWNARNRLTGIIVGNEQFGFPRHNTHADSDLAAVYLPDGYSIQYLYDAAQRLVGAADSRGTRIQYTLDAAGNRVREEMSDGAGQFAISMGRVINGLGQVTAVQGSRGQTTALAYDANGRVIVVTDPLNHSTRQSLDALGRATSTTFPDNATAGQSWNALDQVTDVRDPKNVGTRYQPNAFGEIVRETNPDIGTLAYTRDALGEVVSIEDAKGQVTTINRDQMGRPRDIRRADGETTSLEYNGAGDLVRVNDASSSTRFEHDAHGRVVSKSQTVNDNPTNASQHTVVYRYRQGHLQAVYYPSGLRIYYNREQGRVAGIDAQLPGFFTTIKPFVSNLTHTALSQPKSWEWRNGDRATRYFDLDGRMTANEFAEYIHDAAGRITGISQKLWVRSTERGREAFTPMSLSWTVDYDSRDRVIRFERAGASTQYNHDPNGNRLSAVQTVSSDIDLEGEFEMGGLTRTTRQELDVDAASNRLLGLTQETAINKGGVPFAKAGTTVRYTLDANGSLTNDGLHEFEYDGANRLTRMRSSDGFEPLTVRYVHNGLGQRIFRSEPSPDTEPPRSDMLGEGFAAWLRARFGWLFTQTQAESSLGTVYVYGDGKLPQWAVLGEYDTGSAQGRGTTEYIWLPLEDGSAIPLGFHRNGKLYAVHPDHLGTPRLVTDEQNRPVWQWPYSAFGDNKTTGL